MWIHLPVTKREKHVFLALPLWLSAVRFVVAHFGVAHFVASTILSGPFWREFHENNFFLLLFQFF